MTTGTDLVAIDPTRTERNERYVRRRFWDKVRATLGRVPFLDQALAAFFCATDSRTPVQAKAVLFAALVYFIMPADALPDWLLLAGFTDDAAVLMAAIQAVRANLREEHIERARAALRTEEERAA